MNFEENFEHEIDRLARELPHVEALRKQILKCIPCSAAARDELEQMQMADLFVSYFNWVDRLIAPRVRQVVVWDGFEEQNYTHEQRSALVDIVRISEAGGDLRPYLSRKVFTDGYVVKKRGKKGFQWSGKDPALITFDSHHLHLKPANEAGNRNGESNHLLFVKVYRDALLFILLGDHRSFDDGRLLDAVMRTREEEGLWVMQGASQAITLEHVNPKQELWQGINRAIEVNGRSVMKEPVSAAGTSGAYTRHADKCSAAVEDIEKRFISGESVYDVLAVNRSDFGETVLWEWQFHFCDLILAERISNRGYLVFPWRR